MGRIEDAGLFLGCKHKLVNAVSPYTGLPVKAIEYDMEDFFKSCIDVHKKLAGVHKLHKAATPFLVEPSETGDEPKWRKKQMGIAEPDESLNYRGESLNGDGSKVLMKVLYGARMARFDLLRAVGGLSTMVTKWDAICNCELYRLMCYLESSLHMRLVSCVGDSYGNLGPHVYADADFAGDRRPCGARRESF